MGGIRGAGLAAQEAEKTLDALKLLAAESPEMARAYNAVARRAAALPADKAQNVPFAVESLRTSARGRVEADARAVARRSGAPSLMDPFAFLKEAEWLVSHPELEGRVAGGFGKKGIQGPRGPGLAALDRTDHGGPQLHGQE